MVNGYVSHRGIIVARNPNGWTPLLDTLPPDELAEQLAIADRLEIAGEDRMYSVTLDGKRIRSAMKKHAAYRLCFDICENPAMIRQFKGRVLAGEHAISVWSRHLAERAVAEAKRSVHSDCRVLDPTTLALVKLLPANSSVVMLKTQEQRIAARERIAAIKQLRAAE